MRENNVKMYITIAAFCVPIIMGYAKLQEQSDANAKTIFELSQKEKNFYTMQKDIEIVKINQLNNEKKVEEIKQIVIKIFDLLILKNKV